MKRIYFLINKYFQLQLKTTYKLLIIILKILHLSFFKDANMIQFTNYYYFHLTF